MNDTTDQAYPGAVYGFWWGGSFHPIIRGADGTEDTGSGDSGGGTDTDDKSGGTDPDAKSGEGDKDDKDKGEEKTLTQAEVNSLISKEKSKALRGKLDPKEFGFDSRKELEDFLADAKQKAKDAQSESERALEEAKKTAKEEAQQEVLKPAQRIAMKAEFKLACVDNDIPRDRAEDAFALAQGLDEWKDVEIDDQGVVSGLDETFFEELKRQKPYLFKAADEGGSSGGGDIGAGAGGGKRTDTTDEAGLRDTFPALQTNR